jgi:hypothetical protein
MCRTPNRESVRKYYEKNTAAIRKRKVLKRCATHGAIPKMRTMRELEIPLMDVLKAFASWAQCSTNLLVEMRWYQLMDFVRLYLTSTHVPVYRSYIVHPIDE